MQCPRCRLENPPTAQVCDCGYSFDGKTTLADRSPRVSALDTDRYAAQEARRSRYYALESVSAGYHTMALLIGALMALLGIGCLVGGLYMASSGEGIFWVAPAIVVAIWCLGAGALQWIILRAIGEAIGLFVDIAYDVQRIANRTK